MIACGALWDNQYRCTLPADHAGDHVHDSGKALVSWGNRRARRAVEVSDDEARKYIERLDDFRKAMPAAPEPCATCNDGWCPDCHNSGIGRSGDPSDACHTCPPSPCPACHVATGAGTVQDGYCFYCDRNYGELHKADCTLANVKPEKCDACGGKGYPENDPGIAGNECEQCRGEGVVTTGEPGACRCVYFAWYGKHSASCARCQPPVTNSEPESNIWTPEQAAALERMQVVPTSEPEACPECGESARVYESDEPGWMECHKCFTEWEGGALHPKALAERERIIGIIKDAPNVLSSPREQQIVESFRTVIINQIREGQHE